MDLGDFWGGAGPVLASTRLVAVSVALTLLRLTTRSDDL